MVELHYTACNSLEFGKVVWFQAFIAYSIHIVVIRTGDVEGLGMRLFHALQIYRYAQVYRWLQHSVVS